MNAGEYEALRYGAAILGQTDAGVLVLGDVDRVDFLQRTTTNNIAVLRPGQAAVTILTSPTAKIAFVFDVLCREEELVLLPAAGETAALERNLRGQLFFMDKVRVRNESASRARLRVVGPRAEGVLAAAGLPIPEVDETWYGEGGVVILRQMQYGLPGFEVVVEAGEAAAMRTALEQAGAVPVTDGEAVTVRRIELGRPAPGAELTASVNPLEAGMAWACARNKGCYTGQEILARQATYDKVTRTLVGLHSMALLSVGAALAVDGREVGRVTSAAISTAGHGSIALAIVKRPHNATGSRLRAGDEEVAVIALPMDVVAGQALSEQRQGPDGRLT